MTIDIYKDFLISLSKAARVLPNKPSPATTWRWWSKGVRGQRLETVLIGGRRFTTRSAFLEFIKATNEATPEPPTDERTPEMEAELKAAGLL